MTRRVRSIGRFGRRSIGQDDKKALSSNHIKPRRPSSKGWSLGYLLYRSFSELMCGMSTWCSTDLQTIRRKNRLGTPWNTVFRNKSTNRLDEEFNDGLDDSFWGRTPARSVMRCVRSKRAHPVEVTNAHLDRSQATRPVPNGRPNKWGH